MPAVENPPPAAQEEDPHQHPDGGGNLESVGPDEGNADLLTLLERLTSPWTEDPRVLRVSTAVAKGIGW